MPAGGSEKIRARARKTGARFRASAAREITTAGCRLYSASGAGAIYCAPANNIFECCGKIHNNDTPQKTAQEYSHVRKKKFPPGHRGLRDKEKNRNKKTLFLQPWRWGEIFFCADMR